MFSNRGQDCTLCKLYSCGPTFKDPMFKDPGGGLGAGKKFWGADWAHMATHAHLREGKLH